MKHDFENFLGLKNMPKSKHYPNPAIIQMLIKPRDKLIDDYIKDVKVARI
jgi:hypothetical protein